MQVMAHNLARSARIGLGEQTATTKPSGRRFFSLAPAHTLSTAASPASATELAVAEKFGRALARLRAIPLPA